ncbi:MAG: hypothetical protein KDE25_02360 [Novosphingobium sp.]|nr:hypothetical protein [Novosphingobium sp.]
MNRNDGVETLAKVKARKAAGKPPITRHPLFPATVALWFGALFGIGSLAIRPTLIEQLIVSTGIDVVIPAAAPPLGAITRILLALAMAAIGGTLGAWLARRMSRPKPVPVQRKRGAPASADTKRGARRSGLASGEDVRPRRDYVEHAPLPGGASILDVSQFDLDGFETHEPDAADEGYVDGVEELDLSIDNDGWTRQPERSRIPQGAQVFHPVAAEQPAAPEQQVQEEAVQADPRDEAPEVLESAVEESDLASHGDATGNVSDSTAEPAPLADPQDQQEPGPFSAPASRLDEAEPETVEPAPAPEGQAPFSQPTGPEELTGEAEEMHLSAPEDAEAIEDDLPSFTEEDATPSPEHAAGAEQEEPEETPLSRLGNAAESLFDPLPPKVRPGSIFDKQPAAGLFTKPLNAQVPHVEWDKDAGAEPAQQAQDVQASEPVATPEPRAVASERASQEDFAPIGAVASERIAEAPLDDLSPVELLERLALAMRQKQQHARASQAPEPEPVSETSDPVPSEPSSEAQDIAAEAMPVPPAPSVPNALRPVGLDEDDDADLLPAFIPPRHFGQAGQDKAEALSATSEDGEDPAPEASDDPAKTQESAVADELEEGYSSLLSLSRPGAGPQRFVRIEEPEPLATEIEPVVIFPGKEPVSGDGPFSRPAGKVGDSSTVQPQANPAPAEEETVQRFPSTAPAARLDPEETDRALRTALANLQRMSGAA